MSIIKRVVKNNIYLLVSQILVFVFAFFTTVFTAQYLGAEGFGILSLALAFTGIFSVFSDLGLSMLMTREISRETSLSNKYLSNITVIKIGLVIINFVLLLFTAKIIGYPLETILVITMVNVGILFGSFSTIFIAIFQAHQKMEYNSIGYILNSFIILLGVLWGITSHLNIFFFALIYIISNGLVLIYNIIIYSWKYQLPQLEFDFEFCKITLREALPLSLAMIFALIHFRIDTVLLSIINGEIAVGFYSAAYRIMEMLTFIPIIFTAAMFPVLSKFYLSSQESLNYSYQLSFKFIIILAIPISAGMALLAPQIIQLIYSTGFQPSITILQILIWTIPALFLSYLFGTILTSINQQRLLFRAIIIATLVNIVLNLFLLPKFSYLGAAVATLASESLLCIIYYYFISKYLTKINMIRLLPKPLLATALMCLLIIYVNINLLLLIPILIIVYLTLLFLLKTFSEEEISIIKNAF